MQYSVSVINARLDAVESVTGASPKLRIYSGPIPANCAAAANGTLLVEISLPADWMNVANALSKTKLGAWEGTAVAAGVAGYFRIVNSAGNVCHIQGTAGASGTEMILDNDNITFNQSVEVVSFTINGGGA